MNKTEELRHELVKLADYASSFSVSHTEVATLCNISYAYLGQIRRGENATSHHSNELLQSIIDMYRRKVNEKLKQLEKIRQE